MTVGSVAVELGSTRLRAVAAVPTANGIRILRTLVAEIPETLDRRDAAVMGHWIGEALSRGGFKANRCVVALPREDAVLKRIVHPTGAPEEVADMTQMAMERDLPFEGEEAVIDFVVLEAGSTTTVLAAALPSSALARTGELMKHAGLKIQAISLRAFGAAAIAAGERATGELLVIDLIPGDGIEFTFVRDGDVRFSRAARIADTEDAAVVESAIRETQRTWLSRQMDEDRRPLTEGFILGPTAAARSAASAAGTALETPVRAISQHPRIDADGHPLERHWSLAGLLLARQHGGETIDFASPRKAPDLQAGRRKLAFIGVAAVTLVVMFIWTMGNLSVRRLEGRLAAVETRQRTLQPQFLRYNRDNYKLGHVDLWSDAEADWLSHLGYLDTLRPGEADLVLDEVSGALRFDGVERDRKSKEWSADWLVILTVDGESRDRAVADGFRERLVDNDVYTTRSTGNDTEGGRRLPHGFRYRMQSETDAPLGPDEAEEGTP